MTTPYKSNKVFTLNDGNTIPALGLGTWQSSEEEVYNAVLVALKAGYRHIDTAYMYQNEPAVGRAIKDSGIPREDIFVTTKLCPPDALDPAGALDVSLENLGMDYVDLYLMHWPVALDKGNQKHFQFPTENDGSGLKNILLDHKFSTTYENMQPLVESGKAKSIGVSNFCIKNLQILLDSPGFKIMPAVNQVELHPYLPQPKLLEFCKSKGILLEAYSPLGSTGAPLLSDEIVTKIAKKNGVSPGTVVISWAIWRGTVVLPKSVTPSRVEDNLLVIDLSDEDGEELENFYKTKGVKRFVPDDIWKPAFVFDPEE